MKWIPVVSNCPYQIFHIVMDKLREIPLGIYQLKEANTFVADNFPDDQYDVYVWNPIEHLLLVKVKSRHYSIVRHTVFIHCTRDGEIQGLYCTCKLMFVSVDVVPMWPVFFSVSKELILASFQKQTVKWTVGGIIILRSRCQICSCYIVSNAVFYSSLIQHSQILKTYTLSSWYILSSLMQHS